MNLTVKRCLLGLAVATAMFGKAWAQDDQPVGTVQLRPQNTSPVTAPSNVEDETAVVPTPSGNAAMPPAGTVPGSPGYVMPGYGSFFQMTPVDQIMMPRFNVDSRGGGLYGYNAGYSNLGMFLPFRVDSDTILFTSAQALVTYDGRGGASLGTGIRHYVPDLDRVFGASGWFDFDNGHAQSYQQLGFSLESLGRYIDYRANGYIPVSNPDHVLYSSLTGSASLIGSTIGLLRNNIVEQAYGGFDAEIGGPTPILGRYGLNAYIGGYMFQGMGQQGGNFTGVSGRLMSQINEDVSFGVQVTDDHVFGLNTQFQVFVNLPSGKPGRWLRNLNVRDRLVQNVFRQNRVIARTEQFQTYDVAINSATHQAYFVANIDPNATTNGNGSVTNPFSSIANYEAVSQTQRQRYDIILVSPRTDATTTNLDTSTTLELFNGQRLLSTSLSHTFQTDNLPGVDLTLPGTTAGTAPMLFNSTGGNVITLASGNTRGIEVSGFEIIGSATGNGIVGNNNIGINLNNNNIHDALNGVLLTNLSGTYAAGTQAMFTDNNIHNNFGNGVSVINNGSPPFVPNLEVQVTGNTFSSNGTGAGGGDGMRLVAEGGASIGGVIGAPNIAATSTTPAVTLANTFSSNANDGLHLIANGGIFNFNSPATTVAPLIPAFGIVNNTFNSNTQDGLRLDSTNNSIASLALQNNTFGTAGTASTGNGRYGFALAADSGQTNLLIGGDITTNPDLTTNNPGNTFNFNGTTAIDLGVTGTGQLSYIIKNNTITNAASNTAAAPNDSFKFQYDGTSGIGGAIFSLLNTSDPGITISSVTWDLTGTPANFASENAGAAIIPIVQPTGNTDLLTGLSTVGNATVTAGSNPLVVQATNTVADANNTGIPFTTPVNSNTEISQTLPLAFSGGLFTPGKELDGNVTLQQALGSNPLTSAATAGSHLTVTFSNGLTANATVLLDPATSNVAVAATGQRFGSATPGYGSGLNGIHVSASDTATLNTSLIQNNTITGYGNQGINVETFGNASATHLQILDNTLKNNGTGVNVNNLAVFSGGGVAVSHHDSSSLNVLLAENVITGNFNNGVSILDDGTAAGTMVVSSRDNSVTANAANGLKITATNTADPTYVSSRDNYSGNGFGDAQNPNATGGDNITISTLGSAVANVTFNNVLANAGTGNGLSTSAGGASTLNLLVQSPTDPLFTGTSSFSQNGGDGFLMSSDGTALLHANIYNTMVQSNGQDGVAYNRNSSSLVLSNIVNSSLSFNGRHGLFWQGLGTDAADPVQPQTGAANKINLIGDDLNNNGTVNGTTRTGDGAHVDTFGQSILVLNALNTSFNNNVANGLSVAETPGAQFGYAFGNQRSEFDNVSMNNNGLNGVFIRSDVSNNPIGDAASRTFFQIDANQGNSTISNNGQNGILTQYIGGEQLNGTSAHDILITGDNNPTAPTYGTFIQGNGADGINFGVSTFANATLNVDGVLIGGTTAQERNAGNGINVQDTSYMNITDSSTGVITRNFGNTAGTATLNVNDSIIMNNGLNGINLLGDALNAIADANGNASGGSENQSLDAWGLLNANVTNSTIVKNGQDGVNIELRGRMGGDHFGFFAAPVSNNLVFSNNVISENGNAGITFESNAGGQHRPDGFGQLFREEQFINPPTTPATTPLDPNNFFAAAWNTGRNATIVGGFALSDWMNLSTMQSTNLVLTSNTIQSNGTNAPLIPLGNAPQDQGDGVHIRVGTNSYVSADIGGAIGSGGGNRISGNEHTDVYFESFDAYNPNTGVAFVPGAATGTTSVNAASVTTLSTVFLDDTAQMDLRFNNNTGNSVTVVSPFNNNGSKLGNVSPNGAIYPFDPVKDSRFGGLAGNSGINRLVQLFQVDNGQNMNSNNLFQVGNQSQDLEGAFSGASWNLRSAPDPFFPNPAFPQDFFTSPGDPFLP